MWVVVAISFHFISARSLAHLSSPHQHSSSGCPLPLPPASKSNTLVLKLISMTVRIAFWVKQARNRPLGAKEIRVMGDWILDRQSTSTIDRLNESTIWTELSEVEKKISGLLLIVNLDERTARVQKAVLLELADLAVGRGVIKA